MAASAASAASVESGDVLAERAAFRTTLVRPGIEPEEPLPAPPKGSGVVRTTYPTPLGDMAAYATPVRDDGIRRPAIVWIEGGFGGTGPWAVDPAEPLDPENDQSVRTYLEVGGSGEKLVVMVPSLRGTSANPGRYEMFLGEADDVDAALRSVASRPDVDPKRVYLAGHSTGGTVALLAAAVSDVPAGVVSFGGAPDFVATLRDGGYGVEPFATADLREARMRSPLTFASAVDVPVLYVEGQDSTYNAAARRMARAVPGARMTAVEVPGQTHFSVLHPMHRLLAERLVADKGLPTAGEVLAQFPAAEPNAEAIGELRESGSASALAAYRRSPLQLTEAAAARVRRSAASPPALAEPVLWVSLAAGPGGLVWNERLLESAPPGTIVTKSRGVRVAVDESVAGAFADSTLDVDADGEFVLE